MFKVGDKVVCVTPWRDYEKGLRGTIMSYEEGFIRLYELARSLPDHRFDARRYAYDELSLVPKEARKEEADPYGISLSTPGAKADAGKPRPNLVLGGFAKALEAVVVVGTKGAAKYTDNGWKEVPQGFSRYSDAQGRHELKRNKGETHDADSGDLHLAHEAWNALAKLQLYLDGKA